MAKSVTSNMAMISSWTGLVLPRTAPKEMSTEPVQKSALIILKDEEQAVSVLVSWPLKGAVSVTQRVPLHADVDFPSMHSMEEALHECGPLQREGGDQEVEAHAAEAVALQEGHEEAEANEDHHVHVLETCTKKKNKKPWAKRPKMQGQEKNETHINRINQNDKIKSWTW